MKRLIPFLLITVVCSCGGKQIEQLALEYINNAKVSITSAENVGAHDDAPSEMKLAAEMLVKAQSALQTGDVERAYRLGLKAHLHARIATEKTLAVRQESQVQEAQAALELQQQETEEIKKNLQTLKAERDAQKK